VAYKRKKYKKAKKPATKSRRGKKPGTKRKTRGKYTG
jgi:hypothetical protein